MDESKEGDVPSDGTHESKAAEDAVVHYGRPDLPAGAIVPAGSIERPDIVDSLLHCWSERCVVVGDGGRVDASAPSASNRMG